MNEHIEKGKSTFRTYRQESSGYSYKGHHRDLLTTNTRQLQLEFQAKAALIARQAASEALAAAAGASATLTASVQHKTVPIASPAGTVGGGIRASLATPIASPSLDHYDNDVEELLLPSQDVMGSLETRGHSSKSIPEQNSVASIPGEVS